VCGKGGFSYEACAKNNNKKNEEQIKQRNARISVQDNGATRTGRLQYEKRKKKEKKKKNREKKKKSKGEKKKERRRGKEDKRPTRNTRERQGTNKFIP